VRGGALAGTARAPRGLAFLAVRFPFTFLGIMALVIGLWVVVYLAGHQLDPASRNLAIATVVVSWAFGAYVVIRRVRRGPQH